MPEPIVSKLMSHLLKFIWEASTNYHTIHTFLLYNYKKVHHCSFLRLVFTFTNNITICMLVHKRVVLMKHRI